MMLFQLHLAPLHEGLAESHLASAEEIAPGNKKVAPGRADPATGSGRTSVRPTTVSGPCSMATGGTITPSASWRTIESNTQQRGEAIDLLEKAIESQPSEPYAYSTLADLKYYKRRDHPHLERIDRMLSSGSLNRAQSKIFHHTLGKVYDSLEEWDEAFRHFERLQSSDTFPL